MFDFFVIIGGGGGRNHNRGSLTSDEESSIAEATYNCAVCNGYFRDEAEYKGHECNKNSGDGDEKENDNDNKERNDEEQGGGYAIKEKYILRCHQLLSGQNKDWFMWIIDAFFDNKKIRYAARDMELKEKIGVTITAEDVEDLAKLKFAHSMELPKI